MSRCTLHGGAFLVQRTTFLVQRAMSLRPLDEGRPQSAKKVSALNAFGVPAASLSGPKVRRNRLGSPKRIPKSGKLHPKIDAKIIEDRFWAARGAADVDFDYFLVVFGKCDFLYAF